MMALIVHPLFQVNNRSMKIDESDDERVHYLPYDIFVLIASNMEDVQDFLAFGLANKQLYKITREEYCWKQLCSKKFGASPKLKPESWMELYKYNHKLFKDLVYSNTFNRVSGFHRNYFTSPPIRLHLF